MNKWWGYIHSNGTVHVKRYFGPKDFEDAKESAFVLRYFGPFEASSSMAAWRILVVMMRLTSIESRLNMGRR